MSFIERSRALNHVTVPSQHQETVVTNPALHRLDTSLQASHALPHCAVHATMTESLRTNRFGFRS